MTNERGSAIAYLLLALFLSGLLMSTMMTETNVAATNIQLQDVKSKLTADLNMINAGVNECTLLYPDAVDVDGDGDIDTDDNPNPPYPVYSDLSTGAAGEGIADIICPGNGQKIFGPEKGKFFKLLGDTTKYTATYYNIMDEDVIVTIDYTIDSSVWDEALAQINKLYPPESISVDSTTGTCATGSCLTYTLRGECELNILEIGEGCGGLAYAGSYGGNRMYVTFMDQSASARWSSASTTTGVTGSTDGKANSLTLSGLSDTTYEAVDLCTALGTGWYLPASSELQVLRTNRFVGDLAGTFEEGANYWASHEWSGNPAVATVEHFDNSPIYGGWGKTGFQRVRCVRND